MNNNEIFDDFQLAARWGYDDATKAAIQKKHQRLRKKPKNSPKHLEALVIGKSIRYRLQDVLAYEERNVR